MALYKYRISENSTEARESRDQLPLPKDFDFGAALQCWQFACTDWWSFPILYLLIIIDRIDILCDRI